MSPQKKSMRTNENFNKSGIGCDRYNWNLTGDIAVALNANTGASANHEGSAVLILNDQGGSVMNVSEDCTSTLRAQDHGHPPVVCIEMDKYRPVIAFKERAGCPGGGKGILIGMDKSFTLSTLLDESICYERQDNGGNEMPEPMGSAEQETVSD